MARFEREQEMSVNNAKPLRFEELDAGDAQAVRDMSAFASAIVKDYYDPLIGPAQNDYMIERFQSAESIAAQLREGHRYYYVVDAAGDRIGFVAVVAHEDALHLSKFYLRRDQRGQGFAHQMMDFVEAQARAAGFNRVTLNVNRGNVARFAYEALGLHILREEVTDIGCGFVMDDYVYELVLDDGLRNGD